MEYWKNIRVSHVIILGALLRVILIVYGAWQDANMVVKYTDVDYLVYQDAARLVMEGNSPYDRATYRYTPFLAFLLIGNYLIHAFFGKVVFALLDLIVAWMIYQILNAKNVSKDVVVGMVAFWLFNPFVFTVSTRGNADVLIAFLVLGALYCFVMDKLILGSILYGAAVHFKIYPIFFVFAILFFLGSKKSWITLNQVIFGLVSGGTFFLMTGIAWHMYGFEFLYETYFYHLIRRDNRHNFSVYFYLLYLQFETPSSLTGLLAFFPQILLILAFSIKFYTDLPFCFFLQTITFVAFNKVSTAQYFVWFLSLLPLVIPHCKITLKKGLLMILVFFLGELHWLFWAFQLELKGLSVFLQLWGAGVGFFLANIYITCEIIDSYEFETKSD